MLSHISCYVVKPLAFLLCDMLVLAVLEQYLSCELSQCLATGTGWVSQMVGYGIQSSSAAQSYSTMLASLTAIMTCMLTPLCCRFCAPQRILASLMLC